MLRQIPPNELSSPSSVRAADQTGGRLAAVTCHFNPCGYRRPRENYLRFREQFRGCPLYAMEVSFDGQFHVPAEWQVRGDRSQILWQKEAIINEMIRRLPDRYDRVAWIDADLLFMNPDWAAEAVALLDEFSFVQLFESCHFFNESGVWQSRSPSVVKKIRDRMQVHGCPGGAWAARRDIMERYGLFPWNVVGGGDAYFADALYGVWNGYVTKISSSALNSAFLEWGQRLYCEVRGQVGCATGDVLHLFHGEHANRRYVERAAILREGEFDPAVDVRIGANGLLEWASDKPAMHEQMAAYFMARREDAESHRSASA